MNELKMISKFICILLIITTIIVITGCVDEKQDVDSSEFSKRVLMAHFNNTLTARKDYVAATERFNDCTDSLANASCEYNLDPTPANGNEINKKLRNLKSAATSLQIKEKTYDAQLTILSNYVEDNKEALDTINKTIYIDLNRDIINYRAEIDANHENIENVLATPYLDCAI